MFLESLLYSFLYQVGGKEVNSFNTSLVGARRHRYDGIHQAWETLKTKSEDALDERQRDMIYEQGSYNRLLSDYTDAPDSKKAVAGDMELKHGKTVAEAKFKQQAGVIAIKDQIRENLHQQLREG